ncbi:MAG: transcriptional regulator [Rhodospirillaceae bacterium]|nr:transcriptional regulator [Rhodospirillaceae bacterium]|tara:strand:+ start:4312 stop:5196 length:885 start_codon:yes stop_codon:yes gene_type:complete
MSIRFDDIGDRLKAFRLASGLSADEISRRIGISRTALYRFEKGDVAKVETLEKLADLLDVSIPTLMGVGVEYISSAVAFFERLRQIESTTEHIVVLAGPISFLLASDGFDQTLEVCLSESIPEEEKERDRALEQVAELMPILQKRKDTYRERRPGILNLISGAEIERFLQNGLIGKLDLPDDVKDDRRARALAEAKHLIMMMEAEPIAVQIGIIPGTLPHTSFQIFRQSDRKVLAMSPFRLGEQPNVHGGIAMITSAPEALALHQRTVQDLWCRALRGADAANFLRQLIARQST